MIQESKNYKYLYRIYSNIDPKDEQELEFKVRLKWLLDISAEQSQALENIEQAQMAYNSGLSNFPPPRKLTLIKGGLYEEK